MALKVRLIIVFSLVLMGVAAIAPGARAATAGRLAVGALKFNPSSVNASTGTASAILTWMVTDSDASAGDIAGEVDIRQEGQQPGSYVGIAAKATFDLTGFLSGQVSGGGSGTAQKATFSYTFRVPQYAHATAARWVVSDVTVRDDHGVSADFSGVALTGAHLAAGELPDTAAPTYIQFFADPEQRPFFYDKGTSASVNYSIEVVDPGSGFWKGTIALSGPNGQHALGTFDAEYSVPDGLDLCGGDPGFGTQDIICAATVTIPANAAAGTWSVSAITLTDNAGNTRTYGGLNELPVTVTADNVITASGFAANPSQVNDWGTGGGTTLTMAVTGEAGGVTTIDVDGTPGGCGHGSTTPTLNSDGTYSVPMFMPPNSPSCTITGIAVIDGAGDVSLYGPEYGAPDPGVTITRVPDTTPPVATAASLSQTTLPFSENQQGVTLTITIDDPVAPVNGFALYLYDASGHGGGLSFGGVQSVLKGPLTLSVPIFGGTAPGDYTVGFQLTDAAGLVSSYGTMPNGLPVPGGPLTLTITPS